MRLRFRLKMRWYRLLGRTVLVSPEGSGYAAVGGSPEHVLRVVEELEVLGWTR